MASKKKSVAAQPVAREIPVAQSAPVESTPREKESFFSLRGFRLQAVIIGLIALVFYCNSITNDWAFDDMLVIVQNDYVHMGFSGVPKILGGDAFESFTRGQNEENNQLAGGRYRPLSIMTYAIEQQILGTDYMPKPERMKLPMEQQKARMDKLLRDMHVRHAVSVLIFALSAIVLLYFLRRVVFSDNPMAAFFAALIFAIHPIHTEVVANVKSRDEILSLLFVCLTLITAFSYQESRKMKDLIISMVCFLCALLSKEYGVVLIVLVPLTFYWFRGYDMGKSVKASLVYIAPLVVYFMMRNAAVTEAVEVGEGDVMNSPYLLATAAEKWATIIYVPLNYVRLLLFPHPLAADYTFNQIPYTTFGDYRVWLSLVIHGGLLALMVWGFKRKHVLGYAVAFYFAFLALVSNVFVNIGAPMGERLIYHSSVGFAIVIAWLLSLAQKKMPPAVGNMAIGALLVVAIGLCGFKTIERNKDWKSNATLFPKDVLAVPNSVIANCNAGLAKLMKSDEFKGAERDALLKIAVTYFTKSITLNPKYVMAYLNRGTCYQRMGEWEKALSDCDTVVKYYPVHPALPSIAGPISSYFTREGIRFAEAKDDQSALVSFRKAADAAPGDANILYNLGYEYLKNNDPERGKSTLMRVLQIKPDHAEARQLLMQTGAIH